VESCVQHELAVPLYSLYSDNSKTFVVAGLQSTLRVRTCKLNELSIAVKFAGKATLKSENDKTGH
jgi:hypothetical protein